MMERDGKVLKEKETIRKMGRYMKELISYLKV